MANKLLSNLPIHNLNQDTDFLEILDKAMLIRDFLLGSKDNIDTIKMFSLYGDWGSGKSSLMKFLQNELSTDYNTFFFEAWEFEKDENLALSLLEFLSFETKDVSDELFDNVIKYGARILRGLGKSVKLTVPLYANGPTLELDPTALIDEISQKEELTFYEAAKRFKLEFRRLEDSMTRSGRPTHNIVFIDDLDRCEPQQVLNLISAIKLFFTFGKKTIFFCGVDKSAVEAAVMTKYGQVIKANEYLEKIFDISFSMPDKNNLQKLVNYYFDATIYSLGETENGINERINIFFNELEFTNPRRVKKVLNKYQMLRNFTSMQINQNKKLPNIDLHDGSQKSYFETILIIYLIILHEFYHQEFEDFLNFEKKKDVYFKVNSENNNTLTSFKEVISSNLNSEPLNSIMLNTSANQGIRSHRERSFFICLSPVNVERINFSSLQSRHYTEIIVKKKFIDYLFYKYISSFEIEILLRNTKDNSLLDLKNLIKNFL